MFQVKFKYPRFSIKKEEYMKALRERIQKQLRDAAREFIAEAIQHIPMDTGQARGTFLPFSRALSVSIPTGGGKPQKDKSVSTGASPDRQLLFKFESSGLKDSFSVDVQLFYFWINDLIGHPSGQYAPWEAIQQGFEAFLKYIEENKTKKFPDINQYLSVEYRESR